MKKLVISLLIVCLSLVTFGQGNPPATAATTASSLSKLFSNNEINLELGFAYNDVSDGKFSPLVGASYYPWKHFGIRGMTQIDMNNSAAFNNGEFVGIVRLPLWVVAPYIGGGCKVKFNDNTDVSPIFLGGVSARINNRWSVFSEGVWNAEKLVDLTEYTIKLGVSLRLH